MKREGHVSAHALTLTTRTYRDNVCLFVPAEWHFRSSLDRYVWIHGMICAYCHPWAEAWLQRIDKMGKLQRVAVRSVLVAGEPHSSSSNPAAPAAIGSVLCAARHRADYLPQDFEDGESSCILSMW